MEYETIIALCQVGTLFIIGLVAIIGVAASDY